MVLGRRRRWGSSRHPAAECRYVERIAPSTPDAAVAGRVIPSRRGEARRSDRRSSAICWRHRGGGRRRRDGPPPWRGAVVVRGGSQAGRRRLTSAPAPASLHRGARSRSPRSSWRRRTRREGGAETVPHVRKRRGSKLCGALHRMRDTPKVISSRTDVRCKFSRACDNTTQDVLSLSFIGSARRVAFRLFHRCVVSRKFHQVLRRRRYVVRISGSRCVHRLHSLALFCFR